MLIWPSVVRLRDPAYQGFCLRASRGGRNRSTGHFWLANAVAAKGRMPLRFHATLIQPSCKCFAVLPARPPRAGQHENNGYLGFGSVNKEMGLYELILEGSFPTGIWVSRYRGCLPHVTRCKLGDCSAGGALTWAEGTCRVRRCPGRHQSNWHRCVRPLQGYSISWTSGRLVRHTGPQCFSARWSESPASAHHLRVSTRD